VPLDELLLVELPASVDPLEEDDELPLLIVIIPLVELIMAPLLVEPLVETVPLLDVGSPLVELGPGSPLAVAAA
jgi:hypothetical protein